MGEPWLLCGAWLLGVGGDVCIDSYSRLVPPARTGVDTTPGLQRAATGARTAPLRFGRLERLTFNQTPIYSAP